MNACISTQLTDERLYYYAIHRWTRVLVLSHWPMNAWYPLFSDRHLLGQFIMTVLCRRPPTPAPWILNSNNGTLVTVVHWRFMKGDVVKKNQENKRVQAARSVCLCTPAPWILNNNNNTTIVTMVHTTLEVNERRCEEKACRNRRVRATEQAASSICLCVLTLEIQRSFDRGVFLTPVDIIYLCYIIIYLCYLPNDWNFHMYVAM